MLSRPPACTVALQAVELGLGAQGTGQTQAPKRAACAVPVTPPGAGYIVSVGRANAIASFCLIAKMLQFSATDLSEFWPQQRDLVFVSNLSGTRVDLLIQTTPKS